MIIHESQRENAAQTGEGLQAVTKKILLGPKNGFSGYLRQFTLGPGGHSPLHSHDWYHVAYILEGQGKVLLDGREHAVRAGTAAYVEANREHQFLNTGDSEMRFLCLVPENGDSY